MARYLPDQWSGRSASVLFIFASLTLFTVSTLAPDRIEGVRMGAADILAPVIGAVNRPIQNVTAYVQEVSGLTRLQADNDRLKAENARLRDWYRTAMQLQTENTSLKKLMNVAVQPQDRFVTARVIADSGNSYVRTLLVLAGKDDGIDKGEAVISGEGLAGRTIEAGRHAARVLLLTDINSRVPVIVQDDALPNQPDIRGILAGRNDDVPALIHLPADVKVHAGARVVTSGRGGIFPPGIPVGVIQALPNGGVGVHLFTDTDKLIDVRVVDRDEDPNLIASQLPH